MRNKKGIVESGLSVMVAVIVSAIASTGMLFGSAGPIGSSVFLTGAAATIYTQSPHVKRDFREKKAVREFAVTMEDAKALSDSELLDLIRDDEPGYTSRANLMKANPDLHLGG